LLTPYMNISEITWFHRIDLGDGLVTPGVDIDGKAKIEFAKLPADLTGKSVLDIGAWDGLFSIEAKRRRASRVLATDYYAWHDIPWSGKQGFMLARELSGLNIEDMDIDVMDLSPERVGTFDVTLFLGVLYHLRHPFLALEKVSSLTKEMLLLTTWVDMLNESRPAAAFYPNKELGNDPTNWWGFNPACIEAMLKDVGFRRVEIVGEFPVDGSAKPMAFHAFK